MESSVPEFRPILRALYEGRVDFIVVGGVAAVVQGAPMNTFDLDIVHSRHPDNIKHLLAVLERLEARYRTRPDQRLQPNETHLITAGHLLLMTRFGALDVLGTIGKGRDYEQLFPRSREIEVGDLRLRVLTLEAIIETKEEAGRDKDRAMLPLLRRTLEEASKK